MAETPLSHVPSLTQVRLRELLHYDPKTGVFTRRKSVYHGRPKPGAVAGALLQNGYRNIWVSRQHYLAHRLAWFYMTGAWPEHQIDHINGVKDDNRFANLRIGGKFAFALNGVNGLGFPIPAQFCGPIKAFDTLYLAAEKIAINGNGNTAAVIQNLETAAAAALAAAVEAGFSVAAHPPLFAAAPGDPTPAQWASQDAAIAAGMAGLRCQ